MYARIVPSYVARAGLCECENMYEDMYADSCVCLYDRRVGRVCMYVCVFVCEYARKTAQGIVWTRMKCIQINSGRENEESWCE